MAKHGFFKTLLGIAVTAGAVAAVAKYLKDYTNYKPAGEEDMDDIKSSGEKVKDAAKRTYVAIKENGDVKEAAGDLLNAAREAADDAGRLAETVGANTVEFVKEEKAVSDSAFLLHPVFCRASGRDDSGVDAAYAPVSI